MRIGMRRFRSREAVEIHPAELYGNRSGRLFWERQGRPGARFPYKVSSVPGAGAADRGSSDEMFVAVPRRDF